MTYRNHMIVRLPNGSEVAIFSEFLPPVGSKLTLGGVNRTLRVTGVEFVGTTFPFSMSCASGAPGDIKCPEEAALSPLLHVEDWPEE